MWGGPPEALTVSVYYIQTSNLTKRIFIRINANVTTEQVRIRPHNMGKRRP